MHIVYIVFTLSILLFNESAGAGQAMTLAQCMQTGLEKNPSLQASQFRADEADRDVKMARADFFPALTSSYSINRIESNYSQGPTKSDYIDQEIHSGVVKLTQIIYAGSRIVDTHEKAKITEQAIQAELQLAKLELIYNIETTFYKVMKAKQDVMSAIEAVNRLTEGTKAAEAFFRKELVPQVDVLKARVDLADADNQLSIAKNNENRQRIALFSLMNLPVDPDTEFSDEDALVMQERPSFETCYRVASERRPDIKSLEYQRQAASKQSKIALAKYLPVVRLDAGYYDQTNDYKNLGTTAFGSSYDLDQVNRYWMAGVTLSWELFDGGRSWYENEKYDLQAQRFSSLIKEAHNTIATGIRKALYSIAEAEQRIAGSSKALFAAQENYTAEDNRLKAGVSTITALLDAQSRLVRAKANAANATLDYRLALSELKLMTGGQNAW